MDRFDNALYLMCDNFQVENCNLEALERLSLRIVDPQRSIRINVDIFGIFLHHKNCVYLFKQKIFTCIKKGLTGYFYN